MRASFVKNFFAILAVFASISFGIFWLLENGDAEVPMKNEVKENVLDTQKIIAEIHNTQGIQKKPSKENPTVSVEKSIFHTVPFSSQAPSGQWNNPIYQDGCEEASMIMAAAWADDRRELSKQFVEVEIKKLTDFEAGEKGFGLDVSTNGVAEILHSYFHLENIRVVYDIQLEDIVQALHEENVVIIPVNGRELGNSNFTQPGPLNHMLLVIGYDSLKREFITNDPGTRKGKGYRYDENVLLSAVRDYPTGYHEPNPQSKRVMVVVGKTF